MGADFLYHNVKFVAGQTSPEDVLAAANYPASGSYIDVSGYEWVTVVVRQGAIHASDTPNFQLMCTDSTTGTLDSISYSALTKESANSDDDQILLFELKTDALPVDHHFLSLTVSDVTNGSYADIFYMLRSPRHAPVTQTTALLPSDNHLKFTG